MKIAIFGVGYKGRKLYYNIKNSGIFEDDIVCFFDNNSMLWGKKYNETEIISPQNCMNTFFDIVVICSSSENEIYRQLLDMGIDRKIIKTELDYRRESYVKAEFKKRKNIFKEKRIPSKIVVYCAITGNYDNLDSPLYIDDRLEYVCFTNNRNIKSSIWNVEYISDNNMSDVFLARNIKCFPDKYFKEYELSIWVDGKYLIKNNLREYIEKYMINKNMLCFPHPDRNCVYNEAAACIFYGKGEKDSILKQVITYYNEKYPFDNGLYESGCLARNHNDDFIKKLMSEWWEQISVFSYRDQLSLPYVCWKNQFLPDICDLNINNNDFLEVKVHNNYL